MITNKTFEKYFTEHITQNSEKQQNSYLGITKETNPEWKGWNYIKENKAKRARVKDFSDKHLDILVENFYYIQYLKEMYFITEEESF